MADKKPSGFRFRLPWLIQPALPPTRESPTQTPRTAPQTSVTSTPAQRPPFRPPGKSPAPPPTPAPVATPAPFSPKRSPPPSVASPPMSISPKSSVSKPTAKTIEPVASQPTKETQATIGTAVLATPPQTPPSSPPRQAHSQPSPPQTPPPPITVSPKLPAPNSPTAKNTEPFASQPAKETQTTTETVETAGPAIQVQTQPSPPQTPIPAEQSQSPIRTPPNSPSQLASEPANKASSLPSSPIKTTKGNHLALDEKPRERTELRGTQTKSMDLHSMELKSQKPKLTATRVPLLREIKDDISKFIHKIATGSEKQSTNEKPANIITMAGDNTGASMHLSLDEIKRGYKLNSTDHDASINGDSKAIVNSNIQGINNSLMFNSCVTERNPGVHLDLYRNPANINDSTSTMKHTEMHRAEVNITPPQKLVYDPMEASEFEFEEDDSETPGRGYEIDVL